MLSRPLLVLPIIASLGPLYAQQDYTYTPFDDLEDVSAWLKGDPQTDMEQREVGYAASTEFVKQGKQSLAFMVRVDWTPKPGEEYPRGWPMISRQFEEPQDWSEYDRFEFWLYTETEARIPMRALRCGFGEPNGKAETWHDVPDIVPGQWQHVSLPLTEEMEADFDRPLLHVQWCVQAHEQRGAVDRDAGKCVG